LGVHRRCITALVIGLDLRPELEHFADLKCMVEPDLGAAVPGRGALRKAVA